MAYSASKLASKRTVTVLGTARQPYYMGIGKDIKSATSLETALEMSGLDFSISKLPVQFITEKVNNKTGDIEQVAKIIPNTYATVRDDTRTPLGVVGKNYNVLQNTEAFDFLDSLTADTKFEAAGTYDEKGARSFIVIRTENMQILGDEFEPFILLTNAHDGSGSVKATFTPLRKINHAPVVRTIKGIPSKFSIKHTSNLQKRLAAAKLILLNNTNYLNAIQAEAEKMATMPFSDSDFKKLAQRLFASEPDATDITKLRNEAMIDALIDAYNQDSLAAFNNTVYKATQAVASFESALPAFRNTKTIQFKNINNVLGGMNLYNRVCNELMS